MKRKQQTTATKNTMLFFATAALIFTMFLLAGCSDLAGNPKEDSNTTPQTTQAAADQTQALISKEVEAQAQLQPSLSIGIVYDHTDSFKGEVEKLTAQLLASLMRFFKARAGCEDLKVAVLLENSNVLLSRYADVPLLIDTAAPVAHKNSWISSERPKAKYGIADVNAAITALNDSNWQTFSTEVVGRASRPLALTSDVANGINRAIMGLSEQPNAKRYLILCTDFKDDFGKKFAQIPCDITVLVVGADITAPLDIMLGTSNYVRFESLSAAIAFIARN